jgi:hypothetical protein
VPRPRPTGPRERVPAARERRGGRTREEVASRSRVAASALHPRPEQARETGRRVGATPAGSVAEGNGATLAGLRVPARRAHRHAARPVRRAPQALGPARGEGRSGSPSGVARTSPRLGGRGAPSRPGSTRAGSCPSARRRGAVGSGWRSSARPPRAAWRGAWAPPPPRAGAAAFLAPAGRVLAPALDGRPGATGVVDGPPAREAGAVRGALDRAGLRRRRLPPPAGNAPPRGGSSPRSARRPAAAPDRLRAASSAPRQSRGSPHGPARQVRGFLGSADRERRDGCPARPAWRPPEPGPRLARARRGAPRRRQRQRVRSPAARPGH